MKPDPRHKRMVNYETAIVPDGDYFFMEARQEFENQYGDVEGQLRFQKSMAFFISTIILDYHLGVLGRRSTMVTLIRDMLQGLVTSGGELAEGTIMKNSEFREWASGSISVPIWFEEEGRIFQPEVFIWVELPEVNLVSCYCTDSDRRSLSFPESLMEAMRSPLIGPPRRPDLIRVDDSHLAFKIKGTLMTDIEVVSTQTPALDAILYELRQRLFRELESGLLKRGVNDN